MLSVGSIHNLQFNEAGTFGTEMTSVPSFGVAVASV